MDKKEYIDLDPIVQDTLATIREHLPENQKHLRQHVVGHLLSELPSYKEMFTAQAVAKGLKREHYRREGLAEEKEYISFQAHKAAYTFILDNGGTTDEAISFVCELFDDDESRVHEAIRNGHAPWQMKRVPQDNKSHPESRSMQTKGIVSLRDLTRLKTPYGQLQRLVKAVSLHRYLQSIEVQLETLKTDMKSLTVNTEVQAEEIKGLQELLNVGEIGLDRKVELCKNAGMTKTETAKMLRVDYGKVRRRWDDHPKIKVCYE